ncbi:hypothetical protein BP6252_02113 [Coleophoma cylindrospora]|uniref:DUF8004 domain-containing protein n=1 Tax=Coleophoma cylindrospora TaxID=1849047 RepID=A0A3D8SDY2_9HELO|nr:hypothetical protein BP6252_02113 [Coleophoma cylindrospora]
MHSPAKDLSIKRWDGTSRSSSDWDGLRRDPELWFPGGNCYVHLYAYGQSRRGPAFKIPYETIIAADCLPLLESFLVESSIDSPISDTSSYGVDDSDMDARVFDLYIPAPRAIPKGQAMLYHMATRNFFAWVCGRSVVGSHLGDALIGLLNSMEEWRTPGQDNVEDIVAYIDEEGYADLNSQPDHALAILHFAEHFRFKDLYIDAFSHCVGMYDSLIYSSEYESLSRVSRALISRSKIEMDLRLDNCGRKLGTFLHDELAYANRGFSPEAREHLDRFRSFLQAFYVAKVGYYPPTSIHSHSDAFPKNVFDLMCTDFENLYEYLADTQYSPTFAMPLSGTDIQRNIAVFDARHKHSKLPYSVPLLPEIEEPVKSRSRRMSWVPSKADKMRLDARLVAFSALNKATNRGDEDIYASGLVRAYREFEKQCVFSHCKVNKIDKNSILEGRKVRWIAIYTILQTLLSASRVPEQVRDAQHVPYSLCVQTAGCPPWNDKPRPQAEVSQRRQSLPAHLIEQSLSATPEEVPPLPRPSTAKQPRPSTAKPNRTQTGKQSEEQMTFEDFFKTKPARRLSTSGTGISTVRRALNSLGNMPELIHPRPQRASHHEILVDGYGNGMNISNHNDVIPTAIMEEEEQERTLPQREPSPLRTLSFDSDYSVCEASRWSMSEAPERTESPGTSVESPTTGSRRNSGDNTSVRDFLDRLNTGELRRVTSSIYSNDEHSEAVRQPTPLLVKEKTTNDHPKLKSKFHLDWPNEKDDEFKEGLLDYLATSG